MEDLFTGNFIEKKREFQKFLEELIKIIPFLTDQEGDIINLHSARVALLASSLASEVLESNESLVFLAALYHDIGAVGSSVHPARVINMAEYFVDPWLSTHPIRSSQVLRKVSFMKSASNIVLEHHEWYDGGGFPFKKKASEILPEAQALRVVDTFDSVMLLTGNLNMSLKMMERTKSREYDEDLFLIFKHFVKANEIEFLWFEPEETLNTTLDFLCKLKISIVDTDVFEFLKVFDLKKHPTNGHTKRVRDLVSLVCAEVGYVPADSLVKAVFVHEMFTLYEPFKGSYLGSILRKELIENFSLVFQAILDLEEDPFVNEIIRASCYLDKKLYLNFSDMSSKDIVSTISQLNGRINSEILLSLKKVLEEHGRAIYKDKITDTHRANG